MVEKQYWVIAYDIADDKRRLKVAKTLEAIGMRINYSVFECLVTEAQLLKLQRRLKNIIEETEDCVLYYYLCKSCVPKRSGIGRVEDRLDQVIVV